MRERKIPWKKQRRVSGLVLHFILITCMGLLGLSLYNTNRRANEVGIRKTLGGSAVGIMWQFSKEYLELVTTAAAISLPIALWVVKGWLNNYPLRVPIHEDTILIPILLIIAIAVITVGYHTFKTAHMNPVKLRAD